ncbi:MAG: indole-3-glycerol phosphate synthase TrpC [Chloroflexota bacterium]|nr:indole-3-glycerol phosphate synthase TrpC [Chloroflexota bacterium]
MAQRTGTILDEILAKKRQEVDARKARVAMDLIELKLSRTPPPRDFLAALRRGAGEPVRVIAELKRASPVKGVFVQDYNPEQIAGEFAHGGAAALSVLTDESFFLGSLTHLPIARRGLDAVDSTIPLLRKDFLIDPYQVAEARAWGADACLLIVAALDDTMLATLHAAILQYGMTALVEVNNAEELARAVAVGAALIGVNQRDLRNFSVNTDLAADLAARMPQAVVRAALSGIRNAADMRRLAEAGFDAALVGEAVITAADRTAAVRALAQPPRLPKGRPASSVGKDVGAHSRAPSGDVR